MKRCPVCQKVFDDDKKFCQIDGTPLLDEVNSMTPDDPFKTVVGGPPLTSSNITDDNMKTFVMSSKEKEELLPIPEAFDPMKTVVVSEPIKAPPPPPVNEPVVPAPELPKFNEPSLSPPNFGDLSGNQPPKVEEPPKIESPFSTPFNEPPKVDTPVANPFSMPPPVVESPKFESTPLPSVSSTDDSPFNKPVNAPVSSPFDTPPPPPFKEPEPVFANDPKPIGSPFDQPSTPFGQSNDPFANQQQDAAWNPPPVPMQGWQDQPVGSNTPFQPPVAGMEGQNKTLAIVSLVCGVIGLCCGLSGIIAIITGFMAKNNADSNPAEYGGRGMAMAGIILGFVSLLLTIVGIILQIALGAFR